MTRVRGPLNSVDVRGKQNNLIWSRNQYGPYTRDYVVPDNPESDAQTLWRDTMSSLNSIWLNTLTADKRLGFENYAKLQAVQGSIGQKTRLSGKQVFIKLNMHRYAHGDGYRNFPPVFTSPIWFPTLSLSQAINGDIVLDYGDAITNDSLIYVKKIPFQNVSRNFCPNVTDGYQWVDSTSGTPVVLRVNADLESTTKRYFFRCTVVDDQGHSAPHQYLYIDTKKFVIEYFLADTTNDLYISSPLIVYKNKTFPFIVFSDANRREIIYKWDLSSIPTTATVISAVFSFWIHSNILGTTYDFEHRQVIVDDDADYISWTDRSNTDAWNTPGCGIGSDVSSTVYTTPYIGLAETSVDLTEMVQDWISSPSINWGVLQRGTLNSECQIQGVSYGAEGPNLVITWHE